MAGRTLTTILLAAAILVLAVGLVGRATDVLGDDAVDALAVAGLGLLAVGQAIRAYRDRRPRSVVILLLVVALALVVLLD